MTETTIWPDVAIAPGETLAETLAALGMSQSELARRASRPVQAINEIVQGRKEITAETALELERVLGVSATLWLGLETRYREVRARLADRRRLKAQVSLAARFPYGEMAAYNWVPRTQDKVARVHELLRHFGVASLGQVQLPAVAWRKSTKVRTSEYALAAWLRQGEILAQKTRTGVFDASGLVEMVPTLRSLTRERPDVFLPRLKKIFAERGVALVLVQELPKTGANGATRWLGRKAVMQLSIRGKFADIFWFTLLHELAHLLRHGKREQFIEYTRRVGEDEREREANAFSAANLVPLRAYKRLLAGGLFSETGVAAFAAEVGVHPGIVVGRLQHDGHIPHSHLNKLRGKYAWKDEQL